MQRYKRLTLIQIDAVARADAVLTLHNRSVARDSKRIDLIQKARVLVAVTLPFAANSFGLQFTWTYALLGVSYVALSMAYAHIDRRVYVVDGCRLPRLSLPLPSTSTIETLVHDAKADDKEALYKGILSLSMAEALHADEE
jgi:hypothetical protein